MSSVSNFISFYRNCYRADNRDLSIWNVFKISESYWLNAENEELATGFMPRIPLPDKEGELIYRNKKIYAREKNLVYGIMFVTGKLSGLNGFVTQRNICSPLIYFDADIVLESNRYYFNIDIDNPHLNAPLLSEISTNSSIDGESVGFPDINGMINNVLVGSLINWLNKNSIIVDTLNLARFPKIINETEIKEIINNKTILTASPSAALVLVDRPKASRGILHELELLESNKILSPPIKALFSKVEKKIEKCNVDVDNIPGILSESQVRALNIANQCTLGLVSGPPGTGKSYTIAAIALDRLLQGESVLIVSETDQSIDVINEKLISEFNAKNVVLRAGKKRFLIKLKKRLDSWLKFGVKSVSEDECAKKHEDLIAIKKMIVNKEKYFVNRASKSVRWGGVLSKIYKKKSLTLFDSLKLSYIGWRIRKSDLHWEQINVLQKLLKERDKNAVDYMQLYMNRCIEKLLKSNRNELSKFNKAIRARTSEKQLLLHNDINYGVVLNALPVWLASLDIIHHVLPLKEQLFDLVIIDEATQCNISSVLPALQRGKRALVVGDSKQLKHVSFLSYQKEHEIFINSGLSGKEYESYSYRRNSILDLVSDVINTQDAVVMLDEHYRSKPDLIAFSNKKFYDGRLKIMRHLPDSHVISNIEVTKIEGKRDKKGVNKMEAGAVIEKIVEIIDKFKQNSIKPSIGVLSPFREQTNYLQKKIINSIPMNDIENHAIRVATPYGFQGDEKDYMLLSLSIDDDSKRAAAYLNREDMFNVAITRARQAKYIFVSGDHRLLPVNNLFREFIESIDNLNEFYSPADVAFDKFQVEVCEALNKSGIPTWKAYPVAGKNVDIICNIKGKNIAIDLIGFPGKYVKLLELSTYYLFYRAGLEVFPLSFGLWSMDRELCVNEIKKLN